VVDTPPTAPGRRRVWSVAVVVGAVLLFAVMAVQIRYGNPAWDRSLFERFHDGPGDYAHPTGRLVRQVTRLGEVPAMALVTVTLAVWLAITRRPRAAVFAVVVPCVGAALANGLKTVFGQPRPDVRFHYVPLSTDSFPSGHTATATVVWLTAALLLVRLLTTRVRYVLAGLCGTVPLLVGASRLYLGVHWPTDVIAGLSFGVAWVLGWYLVVFAIVPGRQPPGTA
jgi:undecaprenyl-diphosphatase